MIQSETWETYLDIAERMLETTRILGCQVDDREFIISVIRGLPPRYNNIACQFDNFLDATIDDVRRSFRLHMECDKNKMEHREGAFRATKSHSVKCFYCGRQGHIARNCFLKQQQGNGSTSKKREYSGTGRSYSGQARVAAEAAWTATTDNEYRNSVWIFDSGATSHMTSDISIMTNITYRSNEIKLADGILSKAIGEVTINNLQIQDVLFVPSLKDWCRDESGRGAEAGGPAGKVSGEGLLPARRGHGLLRLLLPGLRLHGSPPPLQFDLYCRDKLWMLTIVGTLNNVGQFAGMITAGLLSDRLGRKTVLVGNLVGSSLAGTLKSLAPNYYVFLVLECLDAFLGMGIYSGALIIGGEYAGPEQRSRAVSVLSCSYTLGEVALGLAAWFVPDWRVLLRVLYIPGFLFLSYIWLLPESMRWLVTKGRRAEALAIFESIERTNNSFVPELTKKNLFKQMEADGSLQSVETRGEAAGESAIRQILGSSSMLIRVMACSYVWIAHTLLFYGLSLFSVSVAGNSHVNFLLVSLAELPAYVIAAALMKVASRRATLALCLFTSATACVSFHWVPSGSVVAGQCLFFLSKCGVTASFTVLYVFTMEMFPTTLRHTLLGFCSMFGRIGSMIAPQAPLLAYYVDPLLVFGGAAYLAALLILIFPETADKTLPDNIKQAQDIGRVDPARAT